MNSKSLKYGNQVEFARTTTEIGFNLHFKCFFFRCLYNTDISTIILKTVKDSKNDSFKKVRILKKLIIELKIKKKKFEFQLPKIV